MPLGRVPVAVLEDGEVLTELAAILDYLDSVVGPERALVPTSGAARRQVLQLLHSRSRQLRRGAS